MLFFILEVQKKFENQFNFIFDCLRLLIAIVRCLFQIFKVNIIGLIWSTAFMALIEIEFFIFLDASKIWPCMSHIRHPVVKKCCVSKPFS